MDSLFYIPSNYEMIEWELIDKNCKIVEYNELNNSNTIKEQVLSIVKFYGHPSTQQIAEDLLFIENDDQNIDPSALLIAKIFVLLSSYDELKIVKKKEVRILEENIDANIYKTEKVIKSGVIKKKKIPINTIPIETLNLQARLLKTLKRGKIHTLNDLLFTPQDKLAKIRNIKKRDIELLNKIICKYK